MEKIEGDPRTKRLTVSVAQDGLDAEIAAAMRRIGYPVEG